METLIFDFLKTDVFQPDKMGPNTRSFILFSSFYAVPSSPVAILPMQVCGWGVRTLFLQLFFIFAFLRGA